MPFISCCIFFLPNYFWTKYIFLFIFIFLPQEHKNKNIYFWRGAETACKQNPCQICDVFVKNWLEFLIHIHDKLTNLQQTSLFVDVWRRVVQQRSICTKEQDAWCTKKSCKLGNMSQCYFSRRWALISRNVGFILFRKLKSSVKQATTCVDCSRLETRQKGVWNLTWTRMNLWRDLLSCTTWLSRCLAN